MSALNRDSYHGIDPANVAPGAHDDVGAVGVEFYFNEVAQKDYCKIVFPGDRQKEWNQPVREVDKRRFHQQWELYKQGKDQLGNQTPLKSWGKIDPGSIEMYGGFLSVKTVEQLAAFPDSNLMNVPAGQKQLLTRHREMAREYVASRQQSEGFNQAISAAEQSQAVAERALAESAELREQMVALQAKLAEAEAEAASIGYPVYVDGKGRGAQYRLSNGDIVLGKAKAEAAEAAIHRNPAHELAEDRAESG